MSHSFKCFTYNSFNPFKNSVKYGCFYESPMKDKVKEVEGNNS